MFINLPFKNVCSTLFILFFSFLFIWDISAQDAKVIEKTRDKSFPSIMSYDGYITNSDGTPIQDGRYDFTFAIYTSPTDGLPIWIENHKSIFVKDGFVRLTLGRGTDPNPLKLPFDQPYYLGIKLGDASEMLPRVELTPTAYSFRSNIAENVADGSITTEDLAPLSITDDKIKSISWNKITDVPDQQYSLDKIVGGGVPAESWLLKGNRKSDPPEDFLGTTDSKDLVFKTYDTARVEIDETGFTTILDTTQSDTVYNGALVVKGGLGVAKNANIGGDLKVYGTLEGGALYIHGPGKFPPGEHVALFENQGTSSGDGIAIKVNDDEPDKDNKFITFLNSNNSVVGRIQGQTEAELRASDEFIFQNVLYAGELVAQVGLASNGFSFDPFPKPGMGVVHIAKGIFIALKWTEWDLMRVIHKGVSYASSNHDYAEYLERLNIGDKFEPGDIVGVFGGKITKFTKEAQQLMVVSLAPIVIGNTPPKSEEHLYEKVAFMGQVLVKVVGPVKEGDYIIPSGLEDGTGIAVPPEMMTPDEFLKVVGRAWSASDNKGLKFVNVIVGLTSGDVASIVKRQMEDNQVLKSRLQTSINELQQTRSDLEALEAELLNLKKLEQKVGQMQAKLENLDSQVSFQTISLKQKND